MSLDENYLQELPVLTNRGSLKKLKNVLAN